MPSTSFPHVDRTDARILRLLYWSPFNPVDVERGPMGLWDIARHLDVHGNTIKRRLADMEKAGVLAGLSLFPQSRILGLKVAYVAFGFDTETACGAAADKVFSDPPVGATFQLSTNEVRYNLPVPLDGDVDAALDGAAHVLGAASYRVIANRYWDTDEITDLEKRVLMELHRDLFASPPDLAARVGVTAKTVRRCVQSLREKKAFCVVPLVNPMACTGLQSFFLDIDVGSDEATGLQILRAFSDLCPNGVNTKGLLNFTGFTARPQELADMVHEIRSMGGVKSVTVHTVLRMNWRALPSGLQGVQSLLDEIVPLIKA